MPPVTETVAATWVGPAGHALNGQELVPGVTVVEIPAGEAAESDNWRAPSQPQLPPAKPAKE